jgi:hypothetical protein
MQNILCRGIPHFEDGMIGLGSLSLGLNTQEAAQNRWYIGRG